MIPSTQIQIPKLDQDYMFPQYLKNAQLIIRYNTLSEFNIVRLDCAQKYVEYNISLIDLKLNISGYHFIASQQSCFLLGVGKQPKLFVIFILGLQKKQLLFIKRISLINVKQFSYLQHDGHTKAYKLQDNQFNVIDYTNFPELKEYTFADNINSYNIIYFIGCQLLKLMKNDGLTLYYLLPLNEDSMPVKYQNLRRIIYVKDRSYDPDNWNHVVTKLSQVCYKHNQLFVFGHYSPHQIRYKFTNLFGVQHDGQYWVKVIKFQKKAKILRKLKNIYQLIKHQDSRILCLRYDNSTIIYDILTAESYKMAVPQLYQFANNKHYRSFLIDTDLMALNLTYAVEEQPLLLN